MIEKRSHVLAFDPIHGQNVFILGGEIEKTASIIKVAEVSDEIAEAIEGLKPEKGIRHVLVNGIGAGEYWSSNRNGDYFPESGLKHAGDDYGYKTFLSGHNFVHHNNKDPKVAVGSIKFAHYNPRMHRCELILATDMGKLAKVDEDIYRKIAAGEPVDVSMGSKCDFDVCSMCSKRSATRAEYCEHLKEAMNQIFDDGRKAYAYTPHPRFFDMSYVTKGADVTAKALHYLDKDAADGDAVKSLFSFSKKIASCPDPKLHDEVSCETPVEIPEFSADHSRSVQLLEIVEPRISSDKLAAMAKFGFNGVLSTLSTMGVILSPEEYQYLALTALGHPDTADKMAAARTVIDPESQGTWFDPSIETILAQTDPENFSKKVAEIICDIVPSRSIFEPYFSSRLTKAASLPRAVVENLAAANSLSKDAAFMTAELAASLALGYLIYRKGAPAAETDSIAKLMHSKDLPTKVMMVVIPLIAAGSVVDKMLSAPPSGKEASISSEVLAPVAGTYLYSAYARHKAQQGRPVSGVEHLFMDYPLPLSLGAVAAAGGLSRRFRGTMPKKAGTISGVTKSAGSGLMLAMGSGLYRPRASGIAGYMADAAIAEGLGLGAGAVKKLLSGKTKPENSGSGK